MIQNGALTLSYLMPPIEVHPLLHRGVLWMLVIALVTTGSVRNRFIHRNFISRIKVAVLNRFWFRLRTFGRGGD